jgi:hypothetical protein
LAPVTEVKDNPGISRPPFDDWCLGEGTEIVRTPSRALNASPFHRALSSAHPPSGEAGEPAVVEGTKGEWRVDPAALGQDFEGRTALLSPFDRLVYGRVRRGAVRLRVHT